MREASGTASVSEAVPSPTAAPGSGTPGMYRGATTSGNRNVTSPSTQASRPASWTCTIAVSRGATLPTEMVRTSCRSCSPSAARWPSWRAFSYACRAAVRSRSVPSTTRPLTSIRRAVTAARGGTGKM